MLMNKLKVQTNEEWIFRLNARQSDEVELNYVSQNSLKIFWMFSNCIDFQIESVH